MAKSTIRIAVQQHLGHADNKEYMRVICISTGTRPSNYMTVMVSAGVKSLKRNTWEEPKLSTIGGIRLSNIKRLQQMIECGEAWMKMPVSEWLQYAKDGKIKIIETH